MMNSLRRAPSAGGQEGGAGDQSAAKRARRNPASNDGPASLSDLPPDALRIVLAYALPENDVHRLEFLGNMSAVCRSLRELVPTVWMPSRFDLASYREYTPLAGPDREPMDCRIALLKSLVKRPAQRYTVYDISVSRPSLEKEPSTVIDGILRPGRICNRIIKELRALLTMEGAFPNVMSIDIDLRLNVVPGYALGVQDTNVSLITKRILKKMPSVFPRLTRVGFGHCLDPDTLLAGNLLKFFRALKQTLTVLALVNISFLEEIHVTKILKSIGSGLTHLEIVGGGNHGLRMYTGTEKDEEANGMYDAIRTHCRQLRALSLSELGIHDLTSNLGKVLDLENTLTELRLQCNYYVAHDGDFVVDDVEAEEFVAGLFEIKGKNLEQFQCDFQMEEFGGSALRNLIALQKRGATTSSGTDAGGDNGKEDEGASQKGIKLQTAYLSLCPIGDICAAICSGVRTIGLSERPSMLPTEFVEEVQTHFYENGVSIPPGVTLVIGNTSYVL